MGLIWSYSAFFWLGKRLFGDHLIWYSWFWFFELEEKVPSAILELEYFLKTQNILITQLFRKVMRHVCFSREITWQLRVPKEELKEGSLAMTSMLYKVQRN